MKCPHCDAWSEVTETRGARRRRQCANGHRFSTLEAVVVNTSARDRAIADAVVLKGLPTKAAAAAHGVKSYSYASRCVKRYYPNFNTRAVGQQRRRKSEA